MRATGPVLEPSPFPFGFPVLQVLRLLGFPGSRGLILFVVAPRVMFPFLKGPFGFEGLSDNPFEVVRFVAHV